MNLPLADGEASFAADLTRPAVRKTADHVICPSAQHVERRAVYGDSLMGRSAIREADEWVTEWVSRHLVATC